MSITVVCPKCKRAYAVQNQFAGHSARCKACQSKMTVPAVSSSSSSHRSASSTASSRSKSAQGNRSEDPMDLLKVAFAMERSAQVEAAPVVESVATSSAGFGQKFKAMFGRR